MANKYDKQLERMEYLMGYRMPMKESTRSNVEYYAEAANGKFYGIVKEGTKYYIKECKDATKANLAESYDYIHGITSKKENEYKSYNEATKQFELKFMSLNEAYGGNVKTSVVDFKKNEKTLNYLTEEARKELDRMHAILENSTTIGMKNTGNPEAPKTASFSASIGHPFEEKAEAKLDKDLKATASKPEAQGEPFEKEEKVTDADLESDKAPKGCESCKDYEDAKYVPADAVAAKKPAGGKVVKVNESLTEDDDILGMDAEEDGEPLVDNEIVSDEELDRLLSDGEDVTDYEFSREMSGEGEEFEPELEPEGEVSDKEFTPDEEYMTDDEYSRRTMESKFSLKQIVESVCDNIMKEFTEPEAETEEITEEEEIAPVEEEPVVTESFNKMLSRIIKEEITNLNVFGKHPGYRKKPMTTPANKEVVKTSGDKDWNDDSVKGEQPFGQKIGSSAPYEETVKMLTDAVMKTIKESIKKK